MAYVTIDGVEYVTKRKYDLEVAAHRGNVELLHQAWGARDAWRTKAQSLASHFMALHDGAKAILGPKV